MLKLDFSNTELAYRYLDNMSIKRAYVLFSSIDKPFLAKWGPRVLKWAFDYKLPITPIVRSTLFAHFCGGETLNSCKKLLEKMQSFHVGVVLDFAEEGTESENSREKTCVELLSTLDFLKSHGQKFAVFKPSSLMSPTVLEKLSLKKSLSEPEQHDRDQGLRRARRIVVKAKELGLSMLIDAEESWIQDAIDDWALELMREFNKERAVIYHTLQMYRKDRFSYLKNLISQAKTEKFKLGVKLVRGAYMEQERERAKRLSYPDPIHVNKKACDVDFDKSLDLCMQELDHVSIFVGTHNEASTLKLALMLKEASDQRVVFSQLYGMSDTLTFNLAEAGFNTVKYVPYGPVNSAIPYLIRRSQENASVQGQMGRELMLIRKEIKRRKMKL